MKCWLVIMAWMLGTGGWIVLTTDQTHAASPTRYDKPTASFTTKQVYEQYPDRVEKLFRQLDHTRPELQDVSKALKQENYVAACDALLRHDPPDR